MRGLRLVGFTLVTFLALGVASVYANTGEANLGLPILGTTGSPALASPSLYSGFVTVLYADGTPVVLESNHVSLVLCNTNSTGITPVVTSYTNANATNGCVSVNALLRQTAPGSYTYSFTPPSLDGTVTIYVPAYALADDNGRIFPSVDTSIGTYAYASSPATSSSVPPAASSHSATGVPATVPTSVAPSPLTSQAVNTKPTPTTQSSLIEPLLLTLSVLAVAGSLLALKRP
jgi:hypothetical protein